jgi:hypothetical protein
MQMTESAISNMFKGTGGGAKAAGGTTVSNRVGQVMGHDLQGNAVMLPTHGTTITQRIPNSANTQANDVARQYLEKRFPGQLSEYGKLAEQNQIDHETLPVTPAAALGIKKSPGGVPVKQAPPAPANSNIPVRAIAEGKFSIPPMEVPDLNPDGSKKIYAGSIGGKARDQDIVKRDTGFGADNLLTATIEAYAKGSLGNVTGGMKGNTLVQSFGRILDPKWADNLGIKPDSNTTNIIAELSKITQERIHSFSGAQTNGRDWDLVLQSLPKTTSNKDQFLKEVVRFNVMTRIAQYMSAYDSNTNATIDLKRRNARIDAAIENIVASVQSGGEVNGKYLDPEYLTEMPRKK